MNILRQTSIFCPLSTPPSTRAKPHYLFANPSPPRASVHVVWVEVQPWFREWHVPSEAEPISPHTSPVAELGLGVRGTCPIRISLETADCQTIREEDFRRHCAKSEGWRQHRRKRLQGGQTETRSWRHQVIFDQAIPEGVFAETSSGCAFRPLQLN